MSWDQQAAKERVAKKRAERRAVMMLLVKVELTDGRSESIPYRDLSECLRDAGLKTLFDTEQVVRCSIYCGDDRITGLPRVVMTWNRFKDQLISNSVTILRRTFS